VADALGKSLRNLPGPVLITGHTGFKGTWMTLLLQQLGVSVVGYSLKPEKDSLYNRANLKGKIPEKFADIRNYKKLKKFVEKHKPSVIFHMAAQPLVLESYKKPLETFDINVLGTANLLDISFELPELKLVIVVTTDKVYRNDESGKPFTENDPLEGKDPYSASKVGTEAAVKAWQQISRISGGPKIVSVRAGNVIGGGDYAKNRLLPDIIRSYQHGEVLHIRNPTSIRPWQHVLDVLVGYLKTANVLLEGKNISNINFGPTEKSINVEEILRIAKNFLKFEYIIEKSDLSTYPLENSNLELNSNLANTFLDWHAKMPQHRAIEETIKWWMEVLTSKKGAKEACIENIQEILATVE
jgi:CDP-glucose 4,6-dehydratase